MVTEVVMTVWIRLVYVREKVKDQDVDEAHGKSEGVFFQRPGINDAFLIRSRFQKSTRNN